jgi:hypothetical protein
LRRSKIEWANQLAAQVTGVAEALVAWVAALVVAASAAGPVALVAARIDTEPFSSSAITAMSDILPRTEMRKCHFDVREGDARVTCHWHESPAALPP